MVKEASQLAAAWFLSGALGLQAQSVIDTQETVARPGGKTTLAEIVVTATRSESSPHETPYYIDTISEDTLRIGQAARTVPEALDEQPGIMVQKTGHGQGSPYIRGFTAFRNLFLIDGIRLNNSVFRDGPNQYWNTVDALTINQIEIVKGPSSSLYGSDAIGGTVNALTRRRVEYPEGFNWGRRLYYRYSSAEDSHIGRAEVSGNLNDKLGLIMGYSRKAFGDLRGGRDMGDQLKTGYDEQDWDMKLEYFLDEDSQLVLAHQGVDVNDAWRTHKTIYSRSWEGTTVGKELKRSLDQDRRLTYLQYNQSNINAFFDELQAGISHQLQSEERDRLRTRDRHDVQGFDVNTIGSFVQFKSPTESGEWIYGADYYRDIVNSFKDTLNPDGSVKSLSIQGPVGDDATYDTLGIYLQDKIPMYDNLALILGGRYEYAGADADSVEDPNTGKRISVSDNWDAFVGNARLLCFLDQKNFYNVFAGVSQGFRAPNLSDLTRLDSARTDEIETPSPGLNPERFVQYEVGLKAKGQNLSAQAAYFYTDIQDMIVRTPTGRMIDDEYEVTKKNAGDGYLHGIELEARYNILENVAVFGAFTWIDGKVGTYPTSDSASVKEPVDRLMPPTGRLGLRCDLSNNWWIQAQCRAAVRADKLSTRDRSDTQRIPPGGTPGYSVYDVRAGWKASDDLNVSVAIENITDEDFRIHGSGVNEPGRNMVMAADWSF